MVDEQRPVIAEGEKFMEVYDVFDRQVSQEDAAYLPAGGLDGSPCALCRWFVSPDNCVVVANWPEPISSIGTSNRFEAKDVPVVDAIPVMIVDGEASLSEKMLRVPAAIIDSVADFAKGLVKTEAAVGVKETIGTHDGIQLYRMKDDSLRWFVWASNKFKDKEGEIFEESAHKEFVSYLDGGGQMPEAWLWHTPGTRWGVADWADYADGFLMYSGTVDPGMEDVAIKIANTKGLGVSHGFKYLYSDEENGIIGWYRDYEISTLPVERAANLWTGIEVLFEGGKAMGFTKERRTYLVGMVGESKVKDLETNTTGAKNACEGLGLAWKEDSTQFPNEDENGMAIVPDTTPATPADSTKKVDDASNAKTIVNNNGIDVEAIAAAAVKAVGESTAFKEIGTKISIVNNRLGTLEEGMKALQATDAEKVAGQFTPKAMPATGHRASQDASNVSDEGSGEDNNGEAVVAKGPIAPEFMDSFFGQPSPQEAKV